MSKDFMQATTEVDGHISNIESAVGKVGRDIAEATRTRAKSGKTGSVATDIKNMIKDLPIEYQRDALLAAVIALAGAGADANVNSKPTSRFGNGW